MEVRPSVERVTTGSRSVVRCGVADVPDQKQSCVQQRTLTKIQQQGDDGEDDAVLRCAVHKQGNAHVLHHLHSVHWLPAVVQSRLRGRDGRVGCADRARCLPHLLLHVAADENALLQAERDTRRRILVFRLPHQNMSDLFHNKLCCSCHSIHSTGRVCVLPERM